MAASEPKQDGGGKSLMEELRESARDAAQIVDPPESVKSSQVGSGDSNNMQSEPQREANSIRSKLIREREFWDLFTTLNNCVWFSKTAYTQCTDKSPGDRTQAWMDDLTVDFLFFRQS